MRLTLRNAFYLAKDGELIKPKGDSFFGPVGYYIRRSETHLSLSVSGVEVEIQEPALSKQLSDRHPVYGVYDPKNRLEIDLSTRRLPDYILDTESTHVFWGASDRCSNFHPKPFRHDGVDYLTVEQGMMAAKAKCFSDRKAYHAIMNSTTPAETKSLGRRVRNYDDPVWSERRLREVYALKLSQALQHDEIRNWYLHRHTWEFVETSPVDRIWGIGLTPSDYGVYDRRQWRGQNLLGKICKRLAQKLHALEENKGT